MATMEEAVRWAAATEAFAGIQNVRGWWSEGIEGGTEKQGDQFR